MENGARQVVTYDTAAECVKLLTQKHTACSATERQQSPATGSLETCVSLLEEIKQHLLWLAMWCKAGELTL